MARRNDHTRDELESMMLTRAAAIVKVHGFEGLTARRLAEEIGYAPGTIYNVFPSMDDLYLRLNAGTLARLYAVLADPACNDPRKTALANMKLMARRYHAFCVEEKPFWLMLFTHRLAPGHALPSWFSDDVEKLFQPLETLLRPYYKDSDKKSPKMAARILWSSVHGLCFLEQSGKFAVVNESLKLESLMDYMVETFMRGLESSGKPGA